MASKMFDFPTPLAPATQVNGPKRTSRSTRFLKPDIFILVIMIAPLFSCFPWPRESLIYPHAVFDVIIDDEVQFLVSESVMFGKDVVDSGDDGF